MFAFLYLPSSLFPSTLSILLLFYLSSNFFSISFHLPRLLLTSFGIKPQDKNFRQRHSYRKQLVRCEAPLLCATHLVTACLHNVKYLDETAASNKAYTVLLTQTQGWRQRAPNIACDGMQCMDIRLNPLISPSTVYYVHSLS